MITEIPQYCLRAYALFFSRHGSREPFAQNELDWIVSQSMKKKIFATLLKSGWIRKKGRRAYMCEQPKNIMQGLTEFRVPSIIREAARDYAFTGMSAIEIWSDYSYIQRGIEHSPYYIKVLKKDVDYWKRLFRKHEIPVYVRRGSEVGEFVILIPADNIKAVSKDNFSVEPLRNALKAAKENPMYAYAYNYMRKKHGAATA